MSITTVNGINILNKIQNNVEKGRINNFYPVKTEYNLKKSPNNAE